MTSQKKDICFATFARNEKIRLPIWLNYYSKFIDWEHIYVIDQNTTDKSTDNLKCNVIYEPNELVFDHPWLREMLSRNLKTLLNKYEIVVLTECDELLITKDNSNLKTYLINKYKGKNYNGATDLLDVIQCSGEKNYSIGDKISKIRNYLTPWPGARKHIIHTTYNKITSNGFHGGNGIFNNNLVSIHIQCLNYSFFKEKILQRIKEEKQYGKGSGVLEGGNVVDCWNAHYKEDLIDPYFKDVYNRRIVAPDWFKNNTYI